MGELREPLPGFLPSCSDSLYLTTFEMVYKLNGYKRKVKVFAAAASYVETPAIINDCNVDHIMPKSLLSNLCHTQLMGVSGGPEPLRSMEIYYTLLLLIV